MSHRLLIASVIGASGVSGLTSAVDLELVQVWKPTSTNASRQSSSASSEAVDLMPCLCTLKSNDPVGVQQVSAEFHNAKSTQQWVQGFLTGLRVTCDAVAEMYPDLVIKCEDDPFTQKAWERIVPHDASPQERRSYPWGIVDINADVIRGRGAGVNVYVLDTGIRTTHVGFGGRAFAGVDHSSGSLVVCTPSSTTSLQTPMATVPTARARWGPRRMAWRMVQPSGQ